MLFHGETRTRPEQRSKNLHNFPLPNLWGNQRHLKSMKIDSVSSGGSGDHRLRRRSPPLKYADSYVSIPFRFRNSDNQRSRDAAVKSGSEEGIEEFRVKIMSDLKTVRDKITQSMFKEDVIEEEKEINGSSQEKEVAPAKQWNLRKRRAACKEPIANSSKDEINKGFVVEERNPSPSRGGGVVKSETKKMMLPKFAVKLSKKEIEEDFMEMLRHRPPRRPKKRPRTVQRKLDSLFPGLYLSEVTFDTYKVQEETKNLQR